MRRNVILYVFLFVLAFRLPSEAQNAASKDKAAASRVSDSSAASGKSNSVESRVEQYLRNLYAWGPAFDVKVGPAKPSAIADLLEIPVTVSTGGQSDTAVVYVSKTGNYLFRGELTDMSVDPFAEVRSKLHVGTSPSLGPEDAKLTLIEFADFECPSCRQLDLVLRDFLPRHPEIRLVFKHFPLTDIHPWAMTAAVAAQCAYDQNPAAFWKMHDAIFDAQDVISPSNAWDKMLDLGNQLGLNTDTYRACMTNPETTERVKAVAEEGRALNITATPTSFLNGRRIVGPDKAQLDQYASFMHAPN